MRSLNQIVLGLLIATLITFASPRVYAGEVLDAPPSAPDAPAKHLFYMHGRNIERGGAKGSEFRRSYERFVKRRAKRLLGTFFIAWDEDDEKSRQMRSRDG